MVKRAHELGLAVYDTSHAVLAEKHNLILATEDRRLGRRASKLVEAKILVEIS